MIDIVTAKGEPMNTKQAKRLRRAIRDKYPNMDPSVRDKIYQEAKESFKHLNAKERGGIVQIIANEKKE